MRGRGEGKTCGYIEKGGEGGKGGDGGNDGEGGEGMMLERRTPDTKRQTAHTQYRALDTGHQTPDAEHRTPNAGHWTRYPTSDTERRTRPPPSLEGDPVWRGSALRGCYLEPPAP